jgi:hypothetical protein
MRAVYNGNVDNVFWFFTTTIGKHSYATICLDPGVGKYADFCKEGAFDKWNREKVRRCFIVRFMVDGDKLTVDFGDLEAMTDLMQAEKIPLENGEEVKLFKTPPGWLAKYLEKSGPETLYTGVNVQKWQREKK